MFRKFYLLKRGLYSLKSCYLRMFKRKDIKQRGQSLIEYLILVALMAIASIGIIKVLGQNLQGQFARVAHSLKGEDRRPRLQRINQSHYKQKDLSDFFEGAANEDD